MTKITNFIEPCMKDEVVPVSLRWVCELVKLGRITLEEIAAPSCERIAELLDAERQYEAVGKRFWHEP